MKSKLFLFPLFLFLFLIFITYYLRPDLPQTLNNPPNISLPFLKSEDVPKEITLIAAGDVMLGRAVNGRIHQNRDFTYPFLKSASFLKEADITMINLEAPFVENCPITNTGMIFCADLESVAGLVFAGIDIANIANNHIGNYGKKGLIKTIDLLRENNIHPIGSLLFDDSQDSIINVKGLTLGFLDFNLVDKYEPSIIFNQINQLKSRVDILIISVHWGVEYQKQPTKTQIELAHQMIDSGASLIIGHHPHVVQPTEEYHGKLIIYSLGNFVFDQPWSEETKKGMVAKITFKDKKIIKSEFTKIYIPNTYQPELVTE